MKSTKTTKTAKKIVAAKGLKQTIDGMDAIVHKLPATHPLMIATQKGYDLNERRKQLEKEYDRVHREQKRLVLELIALKEDQKEVMENSFDLTGLPSAPDYHCKVLEENGKPTGIAFFPKQHPMHDKAKRIMQEVEDILDL